MTLIYSKIYVYNETYRASQYLLFKKKTWKKEFIKGNDKIIYLNDIVIQAEKILFKYYYLKYQIANNNRKSKYIIIRRFIQVLKIQFKKKHGVRAL